MKIHRYAIAALAAAAGLTACGGSESEPASAPSAPVAEPQRSYAPVEVDDLEDYRKMPRFAGAAVVEIGAQRPLSLGGTNTYTISTATVREVVTGAAVAAGETVQLREQDDQGELQSGGRFTIVLSGPTSAEWFTGYEVLHVYAMDGERLRTLGRNDLPDRANSLTIDELRRRLTTP